jgi:hypothetical protein
LSVPLPLLLPSFQPSTARFAAPQSLVMPAPGANALTDQEPRTDRQRRPLTMPQPMALQSPLGQPPDRCSCSSTKPRKPRKKRTECYRGTYYETATGTTKFRKERITCQ